MEIVPEQVINYEKQDKGRLLQCRVEVFEDGAYVVGDEFEMIFEFSPDSVAKAIAHVESLGYVRSS
jgi:hypothetical protein